jgi:predicted lipoprotein with Yx(FWY)xxD motif
MKRLLRSLNSPLDFVWIRCPHQALRVRLSLGERIEVRVLKRFVRAILSILIVLLLGCESTRYAPPPVTAQMAKTGDVDLAKLREGRTLYVSRCIECHALPSVAQHTAAQWPRLIDEMADRANLNTSERNALVAYIVAARSQR